jgi:hypothetical protein
MAIIACSAILSFILGKMSIRHRSPPVLSLQLYFTGLGDAFSMPSCFRTSDLIWPIIRSRDYGRRETEALRD